MVKKLLLEETRINGMTLEIDLLTKTYKKIEGGQVIENKIDIDQSEIDSLLSKYITYWKTLYVGKDNIDGPSSLLKIETTDEILEYSFEGKFPENYVELVDKLTNMVGVL